MQGMNPAMAMMMMQAGMGMGMQPGMNLPPGWSQHLQPFHTCIWSYTEQRGLLACHPAQPYTSQVSHSTYNTSSLPVIIAESSVVYCSYVSLSELRLCVHSLLIVLGCFELHLVPDPHSFAYAKGCDATQGQKSAARLTPLGMLPLSILLAAFQQTRSSAVCSVSLR